MNVKVNTDLGDALEEVIPLKGTIEIRQEKLQERLLEELNKSPIVSNACARSGVSRATYYRWMADDVFAESVYLATREGIEARNDEAEATVWDMVKEGSWPALQFWLKYRHPAYRKDLDDHMTRAAAGETWERRKRLRDASEAEARKARQVEDQRLQAILEKAADSNAKKQDEKKEDKFVRF